MGRNIARVGNMNNASIILFGRLAEKMSLARPDLHGKIIFEWILK